VVITGTSAGVRNACSVPIRPNYERYGRSRKTTGARRHRAAMAARSSRHRHDWPWPTPCLATGKRRQYDGSTCPSPARTSNARWGYRPWRIVPNRASSNPHWHRHGQRNVNRTVMGFVRDGAPGMRLEHSLSRSTSNRTGGWMRTSPNVLSASTTRPCDAGSTPLRP
jgi:hypothetical protein